MKAGRVVRLGVIPFTLVLSVAPALLAGSPGETSPSPPRFGTFGSVPAFVPELKAAGIQTIRMWIDWSEIEPSRGQYDWSLMDQRVQSANAAQIEIAGYFCYTPAWAKVDPKCSNDVCAIRDIALFREFARRVAERYSGASGFGRMTYIEILNEVTYPGFFDPKNTNYEDWLVAGYEGIKAGNTNAVVLIGGFVNPLDVKEFVDRMLRDDSRYYDAISFHVYAQEKDVEPATEYLKSRMQAFGVDKPLWMTETATIPLLADADAQIVLAGGVIKRYAMAFAEGVERVFWWPFNGMPSTAEYTYPPGGEPLPGSKMLGLGWTAPKGSGVENVFHPRLAYTSYQLLTAKLNGFSSAVKLANGQYKFVVGGRSVYVLWCDTGTCSPPAELTGTITATNCSGATSSMPVSQLLLSPCPNIVEPLTSPTKRRAVRR